MMLRRGLFFHTSCFVGCLSAVIIKMKNGIKEKQGTRAGRYERSSDVNGQPSYKMGSNAIWYNEVYKSWNIGSINELGGNTGVGIYAKDDFGGLTDAKNLWKYKFNNGWKSAGTNDITVECTSGTSKVSKNSFIMQPKSNEILRIHTFKIWASEVIQL